MVIIAAIIGGFADIGWEVLSTMRKAQFGQSLLAGLVIALLAMMLDRISWGLAERQNKLPESSDRAVWARHPHLSIAMGAFVVALLGSQLMPWFSEYRRNGCSIRRKP